jgi:hypothetical protein
VLDAITRIVYDIRTNHSPGFPPVIDPTVAAGVQARLAAALDDLSEA